MLFVTLLFEELIFSRHRFWGYYNLNLVWGDMSWGMHRLNVTSTSQEDYYGPAQFFCQRGAIHAMNTTMHHPSNRQATKKANSSSSQGYFRLKAVSGAKACQHRLHVMLTNGYPLPQKWMVEIRSWDDMYLRAKGRVCNYAELQFHLYKNIRAALMPRKQPICALVKVEYPTQILNTCSRPISRVVLSAHLERGADLRWGFGTGYRSKVR